MRRRNIVQMRLGSTSVGMIHKFVPPKEVVMRGEKLSEKKGIKMEERSEKGSKPAKF